MKSINQAYQEGDLARLLEIERLHQVGEIIDFNSEDDLTQKCRTIEQQNQILLTQYENLKRELRLAKNEQVVNVNPDTLIVVNHEIIPR